MARNKFTTGRLGKMRPRGRGLIGKRTRGVPALVRTAVDRPAVVPAVAAPAVPAPTPVIQGTAPLASTADSAQATAQDPVALAQAEEERKRRLALLAQANGPKTVLG